MEYHIFYSWQSDNDKIHKLGQKEAVLDAIEIAKETIEKERGITLYIDQATRDTSGAINIVESIEQKIKQCDIFIADITIINNGTKKFRKTSNPNVMFELGMGTETVGWNSIIFVLNENFGDFDDLPFDIKTRRTIKFKLKKISNKNIDTGTLSKDLTVAISTCLNKEPKLRLKEITNALIDSEWEAYNFTEGKIDKSEAKGIVSISQFHNHIFSFDFVSYEHNARNENGDWKARFFVNESTLTTAQLVFRSINNFGFKTIMFPLDRQYDQLFLIGTRPDYGDQVLIKRR